MDAREDLSRRLWLLRQQLEQLLCALDIQQLVLANQRLRWLPMVSENVEQLVDDIRQSEAERIALSRRLGASLGLPPDATLGELADAVGEPYAQMWRQHRLHLIALHAEIDGITQQNVELSKRGASMSREILGTLTGNESKSHDPQAYGPATVNAPRLPARPNSAIFDRTA